MSQVSRDHPRIYVVDTSVLVSAPDAIPHLTQHSGW